MTPPSSMPISAPARLSLLLGIAALGCLLVAMVTGLETSRYERGIRVRVADENTTVQTVSAKPVEAVPAEPAEAAPAEPAEAVPAEPAEAVPAEPVTLLEERPAPKGHEPKKGGHVVPLFVLGLGLLLTIAAILCGAAALGPIRRGEARGQGLVIGGLALSAVSLTVQAVAWLLIVVGSGLSWFFSNTDLKF